VSDSSGQWLRHPLAKLNIITWLWGTKYSSLYVERLYAGLRRNLKQSFRFLLITNSKSLGNVEWIGRHPIKDTYLTEIDGCFARLRMFDREWQQSCELEEAIVCLDLDIVITGPLDALFDRKEPIVLFSGANSSNPCPYNNSVFMFQAGAHPELWSDFSLEAVRDIRRDRFPDDQGWFWHKLSNPATWRVGPSSGIYAFRKPGWSTDDQLPGDAKIVAFPGHRDPMQFTHLPWITKHWLGS
jgi:hypothetical protein